MKQKVSTYVCCLVMCVFGVILSIIGPLLSDISSSYSLSMSQAGLIFSISFSGFISFIFIGGILAEQLSKKSVISITLFALSVTLFTFGFSYNIVVAFICIFLIGGFGGILESIVSSLVADLNEANMDYYLNLSQVFFCIGSALGPLLAYNIIKTGNTWRLAYFILSGLTFFLFIIFGIIKIKEKPNVNKVKIKEFKSAFLDKKFAIILIAFMLYTGTEVGVSGWMSTLMGKEMKLSQSVSTILVSVFYISLGFGRVICGKLIKYFKMEKIIIVLSSVSGIFILISGFIKSGIFVWIIVVAIGFTFSSIYPFLLAMGSKRRSNATAFAIMVGSGGAGTIIIPFLMGIIGENMGANIAMMSPSIVMFIFAIIFSRH